MKLYRLTAIERFILVAIGVCILVLSFVIPQCMKYIRLADTQIQKDGLRSSFDKLWYGEKGALDNNK